MNRSNRTTFICLCLVTVTVSFRDWHSAAAQDSERGTRLSAHQRDALRREIRSTLFVPDPLPNLDAQTHGRFEPAPGVVAERVTYATQFGMRVPAILYLPKERRDKIPALIVINGHGGDKYSWYAFYTGVLYARAGAAVLTYDPIGEGERNRGRKSGTRAHDRRIAPRAIGRRSPRIIVSGHLMADRLYCGV